MRCSEFLPAFSRPTQNLYLTAMAELDDDEPSALAADAAIMLARYANASEGGRPRDMRQKALLDVPQMARPLCSVYDSWRARGVAARQTSPQESSLRQQEKVLRFRPQAAAFTPASNRQLPPLMIEKTVDEVTC